MEQRSKDMRKLDVIAAVLVVVGGLNWGLVGLLNFDLVQALLGWSGALLPALVYTLVGLAALYQAMGWKSIQRRWRESPVRVKMAHSA
jgi:uncharacterized membrane protein YuzA (DUF378 family)